MPGPRFDGWHHLRYAGDRALAAQHLSLARKVLGFVREQAEANGLQTYKHEVPIPGGKIVGEMVGGQPRVTIVVNPPKEHATGPLVDGFVLRVSADLGAGEDLDPLVLLPPGESADDPRWSALFYGADSFGAGGTPSDLRGVYSHVFGPREQLPTMLGAGPIWVSQDDEVVSWFRGFPSYWPQHYTHPGASYSGFVTIYGHTAFTVPDANMRVMAAAARGNALFVLVASGLWEMPSPTPPPAPAICGDVWASQPYPSLFHVYRLYRLPLRVETTPLGVQVYKAATLDEGDLLLDVPLERAYGAWSFNRDVTKLVSVQLPEKAVMFTPSALQTDASWGDYYGPLFEPADSMPTSGAQRFEITITHAATVTAAFSQGPAASVVAEEDSVQLELVPHGSFFDGTAEIRYKCGDWELTASKTYAGVGGDPTRSGERNVLLYAHLPTRTFVFHHTVYTLNPAPRSVATKYRVFRPNADGAITEVADADPAPQTHEAPVSLALDLALTAMPTVMGVGRANATFDDWAWFRAWDGITTLLTITYDRTFQTFDEAPDVLVPHSMKWAPLWAGPLVGFEIPVGPRYGAGGVYFGSTTFSGPWTWDWSLGPDDNVAKRVYFNGTRIDVVDARTFGVAFGATTGASHDDRQGRVVSACIADAAPAAVLARMTYNDSENALLDALAVRSPLRWASTGDIAPGLAGVAAELPGDRPLGRAVILGHTGKPTPAQRKGIDKT